jgi:hypothetical protein
MQVSSDKLSEDYPIVLPQASQVIESEVEKLDTEELQRNKNFLNLLYQLMPDSEREEKRKKSKGDLELMKLKELVDEIGFYGKN